MMPLSRFSASTAADNNNALAAGSIAEMSIQLVGTNVALCCCRMNMPSAGRAKFADCNVHEEKQSHWQTAVEAVCAKVASSCPRNSQLLTHDDDKELLK